MQLPADSVLPAAWGTPGSRALLRASSPAPEPRVLTRRAAVPGTSSPPRPACTSCTRHRAGVPRSEAGWTCKDCGLPGSKGPAAGPPRQQRPGGAPRGGGAAGGRAQAPGAAAGARLPGAGPPSRSRPGGPRAAAARRLPSGATRSRSAGPRGCRRPRGLQPRAGPGPAPRARHRWAGRRGSARRRGAEAGPSCLAVRGGGPCCHLDLTLTLTSLWHS